MPTSTHQSYIDRMRQLPSDARPPYNWQEFRRRAEFQRRAGPGSRLVNHRVSPRHLAAAAALLVVVCGLAVWGRFGNGSRPAVDELNVGQQPKVELAAGTPEPSLLDRSARGMAPREVRGRLRMSPSALYQAGRPGNERALESWLATLPREPIVVRVGTRAAVTRLEDRIAQVDDLLTTVGLDGAQSERLAALRRERVRLVGSLAQVRYAEVVASEVP